MIEVYNPISEKEAILRVASKKSIMAIDQKAAKRIAMKFPGTHKPEINFGKYTDSNYFPHFHINWEHGDPHIWYFKSN